MKRSPRPTRIEIIVNLLRQELVELCAKRGALIERIRQLEEEIKRMESIKGKNA